MRLSFIPRRAGCVISGPDRTRPCRTLPSRAMRAGRWLLAADAGSFCFPGLLLHLPLTIPALYFQSIVEMESQYCFVGWQYIRNEMPFLA